MKYVTSCFLAIFTCYSFILSAETYKKELRDKIFKNSPPKWAVEQIQADFSGITPEDLTTEALDSVVADAGHGDIMLVRYQIVDGQLKVLKKSVRALTSQRPDQFTAALKRLLDLCNSVGIYVPNCEFLLQTLDENCGGVHFRAPIFCFSKKRGSPWSILVPDNETLTDGGILQKEVVSGNSKYPWHLKKEMAFWRGVSTGGGFNRDNYRQFPRFQLIEQSLQNPQWIDARFTSLVQGAEHFSDELTSYMGGYVSVPNHLKYKYQILIDGNSAAWRRAYWQMFSNSVIIKIHSDEIQWYFGALKPYEHYIPAASDSHDLVDVINWAQANDDKVQGIVKNARTFAEENLHQADLLYYIYLVLCQYAELQNEI
jgi:hypothetical protein